MRINVGQGYRIYFGQTGKDVYLLLIGGIKKSQMSDITKAKKLWSQIKKGESDG
jgi:putative addiction module killer protein